MLGQPLLSVISGTQTTKDFKELDMVINYSTYLWAWKLTLVTSKGELLIVLDVVRTAPSRFGERSNFSLKYLYWVWDLSWSLKFKHLKAHNLCDKGYVSFYNSHATLPTNWAQTFTGLLFWSIKSAIFLNNLITSKCFTIGSCCH